MEEFAVDILIVGGGVAGGATALSLKNTDLTIILVEPRMEGHDVNRGDVLYPSTLEVLNHWNILDVIKQKGAIAFTTIAVLHHTKEVLHVDLSTMNKQFPYAFSFEHTHIEDILLHQAQSDRFTILRGYTALEPVVENNRIIGYVVTGHGEKKKITAKLVVGADGSKSKVRNDTGIQTSFTAFDKEMVIFAMPLKEPLPYGVFFFVNPPHAVLTQVLPGNKLRVAVTVQKGTGKIWIAQTAEEKIRYLQEFSDYFAKTEPVFTNQHIYTFASRNAALYWKQNCVLIGDAAHVSHPISSQGIGMAILDAYVLARELNGSLENLEDKLKQYDDIRRPFVSKVIHHSDTIAKAITSNSITIKELGDFLIFLAEHSSLLRKILSKEYADFEYEYIGKPPPTEK